MEKIKGIIFDFNGVLFWDSHLHEKAWKDYAKLVRGLELTDGEIEIFHGRTNKDIMEHILGKALDVAEIAKHTDGKESMYRGSCLEIAEEFKLAPGAVELLNYLNEKNIPKTIATGSDITNLRFFFENFDLERWFDFNLTVYDDGAVAGKPAPDIYLKAAERLGFEPTECLAIEDSNAGLQAAVNAGFGKVVAIGPQEKHDALAKIEGVNEVVSDHFELLSYLKKELQW